MEAHGEAGPGDAASPRPARPHATLRPGHSRPPARLPPQARCADQSTAFPWVTVLTPGARKRLGSFWEVSGAEREKRAGSLLPSPRSPPPGRSQLAGAHGRRGSGLRPSCALTGRPCKPVAPRHGLHPNGPPFLSSLWPKFRGVALGSHASGLAPRGRGVQKEPLMTPHISGCLSLDPHPSAS